MSEGGTPSSSLYGPTVLIHVLFVLRFVYITAYLHDAFVFVVLFLFVHLVMFKHMFVLFF